ncbi:odorant receptor 131-2-like [Myripristis murdjan]|uniref:odorant receptor 131-2-like n=1 Tax=Myripristis murdjan TaxID=586833 RepID=UPI0011762BDA|nr:odorant receptor 131-2-like [Myripristis murdjan]
MNNTTGANLLVLFQKPVKVVFSLIPCLLFLYVNGVMLFTLMKKPLFQESARYILFGHLLLIDSLHLTMSIVVYLFAVTNVKMNSFVCVVVISLSSTITHISPLNLAVMSLERYAAICFPLRHAEIATNRRTRIAVAAVWTLGSLDSLIKLSVFVSLEKKAFDMQTFCSAYTLPQKGIYVTLNEAFTIMYFLLVGIIIAYTYIAIVVAARSASSKSSTASKAHKTVLMHLLQLCLCLVSTMFNMINTTVYWNMMPVVRRQVQYVLFIVLIIFPRCLSPLIYGLRDQSFRHYFKYYFSFGLRNSVKPFDK